uniref:ATP synthase CF0, subunit B n=1 Tax=Desmarestia aculeata TaxID=62298 RepID=UPI002E797ABB|nr:ATP synthase CF0, subunit B [Desmarestia aculeata]WAM62948.1 ATP synthase CF0, subunit B [Desmarestia aculeata]
MKSYLEYIISNENFGVSLNTDIFETNIINIALLLVILFVVIKIFIIIKEINHQMETTKQNILKLKWDQAKEDLSKKFTTAIGVLRNRESKIFNDVIKEVSQKALNRVILKLKQQLGKVEQSAIVNRKIKQLGD